MRRSSELPVAVYTQRFFLNTFETTGQNIGLAVRGQLLNAFLDQPVQSILLIYLRTFMLIGDYTEAVR